MNELKLCKDCALFIHSNEQCGRSTKAPDYVHGRKPYTFTAQAEREGRSATDCGPEAKFFAPIVPADDYAETMIRRDKAARHAGVAEHDLDVVGRALRAGS